MDLAIKIIKNNIDKTPLWHINNLRNSNINWSNNKIINLVYKLQEESYPTNKIFFDKLQYLTIYLGRDNIESNKFLFCHKQIIISDLITKKCDLLIF